MWVSPFLAWATGKPTANVTDTASTHAASDVPNALHLTTVPFASIGPAAQSTSTEEAYVAGRRQGHRFAIPGASSRSNRSLAVGAPG